MIPGNKRIFRIFLRHSLPLVIVTLLLGGGAMLLAHNFIRGNSVRVADQTLAEVSEYYDVILDEMDSLSLMFSTNPEMVSRLRQVFSQDTAMDLSGYRDARLIRSLISAPANAYSHIHRVYVYLDNPARMVLSSDQAFATLPYLNDRTWYDAYVTLPPGAQSFSQRVVLNPGQASEQAIIRIFRAFTGPSNARIGVIVLDINESSLARAYSFREGEILTVRNREGALLFSSAGGGGAYPGGDMQYFRTESAKYGWEYTLGFYKPMMFRLSRTLSWLTGILTLVALAIGLYLTHRTNGRERVFLANVMEQLNRVSGAELTAEGPEAYRNIFDYLNHHVLRTFLEQDYLKWQKEAMEYRALQMQINPHFLFNTLDTINWKAVKLSEGENDVSRMIQLLSKLLKYSLLVDDFAGVPLARELEMTGVYLELQRIRFRDRFTWDEEIDPDLLDVRVPPLLIQPILENALNHGLVEGRVLSLRLNAAEREGEMELTVANDGKPMDPATMEAINGGSSDALKKTASLGLMNVNKRLTLLCHGKSCLTVSSPGGEGARVTLRLPLGGN